MRVTLNFPRPIHWYKSQVTYEFTAPIGTAYLIVSRDHGSIEWQWIDGNTWHLNYGPYNNARSIEVNGTKFFKGRFITLSRFSYNIEWRDWNTDDLILTTRNHLKPSRRRVTYRNADEFLIGKYLWRCNPKWKPDSFAIKPAEDYLIPIIYADLVSQFEPID